VARTNPRPAVFLDRDGTINVEVDYLSAPDQVELLPGAARAIARLNEAGYATVIVTNQSGVARGKFSEARLEEIHARLLELLEAQGAVIDAIYHCPHHPTLGEPPYRRACDCRKPLPGLFERAARELDLDLRRSWAVGDSPRDLESAAALGVPGILVASGQALSPEQAERYVLVRDLSAAVERILAEE
jgi:D-glycero-D-manno-heptose 1,7-bisphosphate phosphatase